MLAESFESVLCQVRARKSDRGERREREFSKVDIVEANDGKVLRHAKVLHVDRAQDADGRHVIRTDDRGRPRAERLQLSESDYTALEGVIAFDDPLFLDGEFAFLHRCLKIVQAGDGRMQLA